MRASLLYITRDSFRPLISFFPLFFVEKFDAFWKRSIIVVRTRVMVDNILQVLASLKSILFYPPGAVQMEFLKSGAFHESVVRDPHHSFAQVHFLEIIAKHESISNVFDVVIHVEFNQTRFIFVEVSKLNPRNLVLFTPITHDTIRDE